MVNADEGPAGLSFGREAPRPANESARLRTLDRYRVLDTGRDARFESLVAEIAQVCEVPIATIAFLDAHRQWFKASVGLVEQETSRDVAICSHTILDADRPLVIEDMTLDPRFSDNPLVLDDPRILAYAGVPVVAPDGMVIGTVCAMDVQVRSYTPQQIAVLERIAAQVIELLETSSAAERIAAPEHRIDEADDATVPGATSAPEPSANEVLALTRPLIEAIGDSVPVVTVVERFCTAVLETFGWWAARVAWVQGHNLVPESWVIGPSAPPILERLALSTGVPVELDDLAVMLPEPTLFDVGMLHWLADRDVVTAVGGRHAVVLDVPVSGLLGARLVFVLPSSRGLSGSAARTLTTASAILPRVIAQDRTRRELTYRATHDMLTGLLNREGLFDRYPASAASGPARRAVLYIDLDGFKNVNDDFGHRAGDEVLIHVARQVAGRIRPTDTAVRLGGDEFLVVLDGIEHEDEAVRVARRLLRALCGPMTAFRRHHIPLAVSIGVAMWGEGMRLSDTIDAADQLMYAAKELGGAAIAVHGNEGRSLLGRDDSDRRDLDAVLAGAMHARVAPVLDGAGAHQALRVELEVEVRHPAVTDLIDLIVHAVAAETDGEVPEASSLLLVPGDELWVTDGLVLRVVVGLAAAMPAMQVRVVLQAGPNGALGADQALLIRDALGVGLVVGGFGTTACSLALVDRVRPVGIELTEEAVAGSEAGTPSSVVVAALAVARQNGLLVIVPAAASEGISAAHLALEAAGDIDLLFVDHGATVDQQREGSRPVGGQIHQRAVSEPLPGFKEDER